MSDLTNGIKNDTVSQPPWYVQLPDWVAFWLRVWHEQRKTGSLTLNYHRGTVGSVEAKERFTE